MKSLFCTADKVGIETGGGAVTANELEVLRSVSDIQLVLSRDNISPELFKQTDSPFLWDYLALQEVKGNHFDLAHFYSGCFSETVRYLKEHGTTVSYTVAAHDRALSIEEFHRLGMEYPFHHVTDERLWQICTEGIRLADVVIAPSKRSAEILKSMGCKNVKVIPHGINLPKNVKPISERFDIAYLGAVGPDKGLIYLIQAWGMLNYSDSRLILAGWGTESLEPFIRQVTDRGDFVLLGRVPDVADVYNACSVYIQPCFSAGTKLFMKDVVETIDQISEGDEVWSLNQKGELELTPIIKVYRQHYEGRMISIKNKQVSQLVTPNHRVYLTRYGKRLRVVEADKLLSITQRYRIPTIGAWRGRDDEYISSDELYPQRELSHAGKEGYFRKWQEAMKLRQQGWGSRKISKKIGIPEPTISGWIYNGAKPYGNLALLPNRIHIPTFFELIGWFISEGNLSKQGHIIITNYSESNKQQICSLIQSLQLKPTVDGGDIHFYCLPLMHILRECGLGAKNKTIPSWCLAFSSAKLRYLYDGMMAGDGSRKGHHFTYYTSSDRLVPRFAELCIKLGYSPKVVKRTTQAHIIKASGQRIKEANGWYISVREKHQQGTIKPEHITQQDYKGEVWCVSTKNKNLFVVKDNLISLSGNSVTEGYGLEIPEAMSFGRPVIASEGAGASELLVVDCGFIVPIRNAKAIAEHIDWLKNNRDKLLEMGQKAQKKAENYMWEKIREKYAAIFSTL